MQVPQLQCLKCGYSWYPRIIRGRMREPKVCPRCSNPYWNRRDVKRRQR